MLLVRTYLAPSRIEGVGLFAAEPIAAGASIWRLDRDFDRMLSGAEVTGLEPPLREFVERYSYPYPHDPSQLIVEMDNGRFMNHSEAPNTNFTDPDRGFARADIAADEELTCNYGEFDPGFEMLPGRSFT